MSEIPEPARPDLTVSSPNQSADLGGYFDNAATTRTHPDVIGAMLPWLGPPSNPSSIHQRGTDAHRAVEKARREVATAVRSTPDDVIFTSGGTESNNLAIKGVVLASTAERRHVVATAVEHASVRDALQSLEPLGASIDWVAPDREGRVNAHDVAKLLRPETCLVAAIHGQNEIGTIQPIEEIARLLSGRDRPPHFHVDAVQSFGKIAIPKLLVPHSLSLSSHKIHGPMGIGALVLSRRRPLWTHQSGGDQERGLRAGTENVAAIVGFGVAAARLSHGSVSDSRDAMIRKRERVRDHLSQCLPNVRILTPEESALPHIVTMVVPDVPGEILVRHLDSKGITVSQGSACQAAKKDISPTAVALGLQPDEVRRMIRLSLSSDTTDDEVSALLETLPRALSELREICR